MNRIPPSSPHPSSIASNRNNPSSNQEEPPRAAALSAVAVPTIFHSQRPPQELNSSLGACSSNCAMSQEEMNLEEIKENLRAWVNKAPDYLQPYYKRTARTILNNYTSKAPHLDLNSHILASLPTAIFSFTHLEHLYLANNSLTSLPDLIGNLTNLKMLYLSNNHLSSLPETLSLLTNLEQLHLDENHLNSFSNAYSSLTNLRLLDLSNNNFTSIPEMIYFLEDLNELFLDDNQISSLHPDISNLTHLQNLTLSGNLISSLPEEISSLIYLEEFFLTDNACLTSLPLGIFALNEECEIELSGCSFSTTVLERIRATVNDPEYQGPRISHSLIERAIDDPNHSIHELIEELYMHADLTYPAPFPLDRLLPNNAPSEASESVLPETIDPKLSEDLRSWLARLSYIAEFSKEDDAEDALARKEALARKIVEYLELAAHPENRRFRDEFFQIIDGAATTCGDRMALSIVYLGIAKRLATVDRDDLQNVYDLLINGVWTIDQLCNAAHEKTKVLRFFDEIEVHLGFLIPLRESLHIPLDVQEMLYFKCSNLSIEDLNEAKENILLGRQDLKAVCAFLISQPLWRELLEKKRPEEFANASESCDPMSALLHLTQDILHPPKRTLDLIERPAK